LQLFLVRPRNLAGPWKAGNLEALVYFKFNRYQAVLRFFEVPYSVFTISGGICSLSFGIPPFL